ncbi:MAG: hypothetical protein Q4B60_00820 [Erysipelotrichaceae bacterium]|nr:hypothetical protein [Erysipelotrichaceae bacterium]
MRYELFGVSPVGNLEFLGIFHKENIALDAVDHFTGLGYKKVKMCGWKVK